MANDISASSLAAVQVALNRLAKYVQDNPGGSGTNFTFFVQTTTPVGTNGDLWLNTSTNNLCKKENSIWVQKGNIKGSTGLTGATGATGPKGDTGDTGVAGTNGTDGATWYTGSDLPTSALGTTNDLYLNTTTQDIYVKTAGGWGTSVCNIKGVTGEQGVQGDTGPIGESGVVFADAPLTYDAQSQTIGITILSRRVAPDVNTLGCYLFDETNYNATTLVNSGSENTGVATTAFARTLNDANSCPGRLGGLFGRYLRIPNTSGKLPTGVYSGTEAPYEVAISTARRFTISYWTRLWGTSYTGSIVGRPFYKQAKQGTTWSEPFYVLTPMEFWTGGYGALSYNAVGSVLFVGGLSAQTLYPYSLLSLSTAEWIHFAFRYDGSSIASFVNGELVASTTTMTNGTVINNQDINWDAHGPWVINRGNGESYPGTFDLQDLRIENIARSDTYLLDLYERGVKRKI